METITYCIILKAGASKSSILDALSRDTSNDSSINSNEIPDRAIEISAKQRRPWNDRIFEADLTHEEYSVILAHPNVFAVEPPRPAWNDKWTDTITQELIVTRFPEESEWGTLGNIGLSRHSREANPFRLIGPPYSRKFDDLDYQYDYSGANTDLVIQEGNFFNHTLDEFLDLDGEVRFVKYQWNRHFPDTGSGGSHPPVGSNPGDPGRDEGLLANGPWLFPDLDYDALNNRVSSHTTAVAAIAGGVDIGWAKSANLYSLPYNLIPTEYAFDAIRLFHENKSDTPAHRKPTVVNASWGRKLYTHPTGRGQEINRIFFRANTFTSIEDINEEPNPRLWKYGIVSAVVAGFPINYPSTLDRTEVHQLTDSGVHYVKSAGNQWQKLDIPDGIDYDNYVTLTKSDATDGYVAGTPLFYNRGAGNISNNTIVVGNLGIYGNYGVSFPDEFEGPDSEVIYQSSEKGPRVDTWAAGTHIITIDANGIPDKGIGTSYSTPQVSGMLCLLLEKYPTTSPAEGRKYFRDLAVSTDTVMDDNTIIPIANTVINANGDPTYFGGPNASYRKRKLALLGASNTIPYLERTLTTVNPIGQTTLVDIDYIGHTDPASADVLAGAPNTDPITANVTLYASRYDPPDQDYRYYKIIGYDDFDRTTMSTYGALNDIRFYDENGTNLLGDGLQAQVPLSKLEDQPDTGWIYHSEIIGITTPSGDQIQRTITMGSDCDRTMGEIDKYYVRTPASALDGGPRFNYKPRAGTLCEFTIDFGAPVRLANAFFTHSWRQVPEHKPPYYVSLYASEAPFDPTVSGPEGTLIGEINRLDLTSRGYSDSNSGSTAKLPEAFDAFGGLVAAPTETFIPTDEVEEEEEEEETPDIPGLATSLQADFTNTTNNWETIYQESPGRLHPIFAANSTVIIDTTQSYAGDSSLKWTLTQEDSGSSGFHQLLFSDTKSVNVGDGWTTATPEAQSFEDYGIQIPSGKKWIYSVWIKTDYPHGNDTATWTDTGDHLGAAGFAQVQTSLAANLVSHKFVYYTYDGARVDKVTTPSFTLNDFNSLLAIPATTDTGDHVLDEDFSDSTSTVNVEIAGRNPALPSLEQSPGFLRMNLHSTTEAGSRYYYKTFDTAFRGSDYTHIRQRRRYNEGANNDQLHSKIWFKTPEQFTTDVGHSGIPETLDVSASDENGYITETWDLSTHPSWANNTPGGEIKQVLFYICHDVPDHGDTIDLDSLQVYKPDLTPGDWVRCYITVDLRDSSATNVILGVQADRSTEGPDRNIWYDGFQFEETAGARILPGALSDPDDRSISDLNRAMADGKIVTHYSKEFGGPNPYFGPVPNITPQGLPNPTPHGDFWINTSNNNILFRYHQNSSDTTAQTVNYGTDLDLSDLTLMSNSGWYNTQDLTIVYNTANISRQDSLIGGLGTEVGLALTDAAFALSVADTDIAAYFYGNTITAETITFTTDGAATPAEFGDIWINVGPENQTAEGTLAPAAIHRAENTTSGAAGTLYWQKTPDNAIGKVYLDTWAAKNTADRKTLTFIEKGFKESPAGQVSDGVASVYGPNAAYHGGMFNSNPDGDMWLDISRSLAEDGAGPKNRMYIYKVNSTVQWAQTINAGVFTFGPSSGTNTGWWDALDSKVNTAIHLGQNVHESIFGTGGLDDRIIDLLDDIAVQQSLMDHVVAAFFIEETGAAFKRFGTYPTDTAQFGDIWINTGSYNIDMAVGELGTNAIHRYQNTSYGAQAVDGTLVWEHTPNSAFGKVYLAAAAARNVADRMAFTFVSNSFKTAGGSGLLNEVDEPVDELDYFGPNVAYIDGFFNANPDGDMWFDTTVTDLGTPCNTLYVYKTNSNFNSGDTSVYSAEFAQTIHSGTFNSDQPTGWWDAIDSRVTRTSIAADREIVAFFQPSFWADAGEARGNGDIWIHTDNLLIDGITANASAVHRYDRSLNSWISSPHNAIGLMYLHSYTAGKVSSDNKMPRGYSLFDQPTGDYDIKYRAHGEINDYATEIPSRVPQGVPYPITTGDADDTEKSGDTLPVIDTSGGANAHTGSTSLKVITYRAVGGGGGRHWVAFANSVPHHTNSLIDNYSIAIPKGSRWILSCWAKTNAATSAASTILGIEGANSTHNYSGYLWGGQGTGSGLNDQTLTTTNEWQQISYVFDLRADAGIDSSEGEAQYSGPVSEWNRIVPVIGAIPDAIAREYWFDEFQLEQVNKFEVEPSPFQFPDSSSGVLFGRQISDGKVVVHYDKSTDWGDATDYGLPPNTTPTGLPNPDPNGDLWIDLANNNIMFQYYSNSEYGTGTSNDVQDTTDSQRMIWTGRPLRGDYANTPGWYFVQDSAIKARLEAFAANSQATYAIDSAVKVFAERADPVSGEGPESKSAGDVWFDVGNKNRQYIADGPNATVIANHGEDGILGHQNTLGFVVGPMYDIVGGPSYDADQGPWHWVETRDKQVLFSLAGNDPFNLNPFLSRGYETDEQTPDGWFPCKTLDDNPFYEHPTQGAITFSDSADISRSDDAQSGDGNNSYSIAIKPPTSGAVPTLAVWSNTFPIPMMTNSFITGAVVARKDAGTGVPGLIIDVYHRKPGGGNSNHFTRSIATVGDHTTTSAFGYSAIPFVAKVPHTRQIYRVDFKLGYANITANASPGDVNARWGLPPINGGFGDEEEIQTSASKLVGDTIQTGGLTHIMNASGTSTAYFDQIYFDINHPDLATDREGSLLRTYFKSIDIVDSDILRGNITGSAMKDGTINGTQISTDYIYSNTIQANSISSGKITVGLELGDTGTITLDGETGRIIIREV